MSKISLISIVLCLGFGSALAQNSGTIVVRKATSESLSDIIAGEWSGDVTCNVVTDAKTPFERYFLLSPNGEAVYVRNGDTLMGNWFLSADEKMLYCESMKFVNAEDSRAARQTQSFSWRIYRADANNLIFWHDTKPALQFHVRSQSEKTVANK